MPGLMYPKSTVKRKKRKKHAKSILQEKEDKRCYLCMLEGDDRIQQVEEHHIYFGPNRAVSEANGFKCNLCLAHHRTGEKAVHINREQDLRLKQVCKKEYEKDHTREEFRALIGKSYL